MYHTQQLQQPPSFTYLSNHPTIPNPNPSFFSYPQPAVHHAEPAIYPPGIDPDADSGSHPSTHVGIENQIPTQYYVDPNAVSVAWVTWQAGSLTYENVRTWYFPRLCFLSCILKNYDFLAFDVNWRCLGSICWLKMELLWFLIMCMWSVDVFQEF